MDYLFAPFIIFQLMPLSALTPALLLMFLLFRHSPNPGERPLRLVMSCSLLWIAYAIWEYRVKIWAENEIAPIRVDLLLIYPVLTLLSVCATIALWRWRRAATRDHQ